MTHWQGGPRAHTPLSDSTPAEKASRAMAGMLSVLFTSGDPASSEAAGKPGAGGGGNAPTSEVILIWPSLVVVQD